MTCSHPSKDLRNPRRAGGSWVASCACGATITIGPVFDNDANRDGDRDRTPGDSLARLVERMRIHVRKNFADFDHDPTVAPAAVPVSQQTPDLLQ